MKLLKTYLSKPPSNWSATVALAVYTLSIVSSVILWRHPSFSELFVGHRASVYQGGEWWRLFTATFLHSDVQHLLSNSLFFLIFGFLLFGYFGAWVFPVASVVGAAVVNAITLYFYPDPARLVGASGMVYLMAGAWAALFFFIERKERAIRRLGVVVMVVLVLFMPTHYEPRVSYLAHYSGFWVGVFFATLYFMKNRERIRAHEVYLLPESPDLDAELLELDENGNTQVNVVP